MASILFDMNPQREELQARLKDFDELENKLYPEIRRVVEDLGYGCVVSLILNDKIHCYDTFRIGAHTGSKIVALVDVKFASAIPTGDYKVMRMTPDGKTAIEHEMCGRSDLIDIIESMLARSTNGTAESKMPEENWGTNNPDGYKALASALKDAGWDVSFENVGEEVLVAQKHDTVPVVYSIQYDGQDNRPWKLYDGNDGDFIDAYADSNTLVSVISKKQN